MYDLEFLPTPSARRATAPLLVIPDAERISTHALREEGDSCLATGLKRVPNFYPRPPRGGRPFSPPAAPVPHRDFYPRPPRGGRLYDVKVYSLKAEDFYPRPPRGGRRPGAGSWNYPADFYPRPPRGGRLAVPRNRAVGMQFLPTPSARRATVNPGWVIIEGPISTHALREEGDQLICVSPGGKDGFLPTPSARRATTGGGNTPMVIHISTHALREEGDLCERDDRRQPDISTHALREEGDSFNVI